MPKTIGALAVTWASAANFVISCPKNAFRWPRLQPWRLQTWILRIYIFPGERWFVFLSQTNGCFSLRSEDWGPEISQECPCWLALAPCISFKFLLANIKRFAFLFRSRRHRILVHFVARASSVFPIRAPEWYPVNAVNFAECNCYLLVWSLRCFDPLRPQ